MADCTKRGNAIYGEEFYIGVLHKKEPRRRWNLCMSKEVWCCFGEEVQHYGCEKALTTHDYGMWFSNLFSFKFVGWTDSD